MKMKGMLNAKTVRRLTLKNDSRHPRTKPGADPGREISITLFGGSGYIEPFGSKSCPERAPLRIWSNTGVEGGIHETPFILYRNELALTSWKKFKTTSAPPGQGKPGAVFPGPNGLKSVSRRGRIERAMSVSGSRSGAPTYLRIAELIPPSKPVGPRGALGSALTQ